MLARPRLLCSVPRGLPSNWPAVGAASCAARSQPLRRPAAANLVLPAPTSWRRARTASRWARGPRWQQVWGPGSWGAWHPGRRSPPAPCGASAAAADADAPPARPQATIVYKFGGSSVATADRMREVADIVCSFPEHLPCVVLSAMGKVCSGYLDRWWRLPPAPLILDVLPPAPSLLLHAATHCPVHKADAADADAPPPRSARRPPTCCCRRAARRCAPRPPRSRSWRRCGASQLAYQSRVAPVAPPGPARTRCSRGGRWRSAPAVPVRERQRRLHLP